MEPLSDHQCMNCHILSHLYLPLRRANLMVLFNKIQTYVYGYGSYYFLLHISRKKYCFEVKFSKRRFWFTHFEVTWIRKSHFQRLICLFLSLSPWVWVYVSLINITQKQITPESSNLPFYISIVRRFNWNFLWRWNKKNLCTGAHKKF